MSNKLKFVCIILSILYILLRFESLYLNEYNDQNITVSFSFAFTSLDFLLFYTIWFIYGIISEKTNWKYVNSTEDKIVNCIFIAISFICIITNFIIDLVILISIPNIVYILIFIALLSLVLAFGGLMIHGIRYYANLNRN